MSTERNELLQQGNPNGQTGQNGQTDLLGAMGYEPSIPTATVTKEQSLVFAGREIQRQPDSFEGKRRSMRLVTSDDSKLGDVLVVSGNDVTNGEAEFRMGGFAYDTFCKLNDLRSSNWFLQHPADIRQDLANEHIARLEDKDIRFFHETTEEGDYLLNFVPDRRPVLSDIDFLKVVEEEFGDELQVHDFRQNTRGLDLRLLLKSGDFEVKPGLGDIVRTGYLLRNSQIGAYSLEVDGFTHRLSCLNGATTESRIEAWNSVDKSESLGSLDLRKWTRQSLRNLQTHFANITAATQHAAEVPASMTLLSDIITKYHLNKKAVTAIDEAYMKEPAPIGQIPSLFLVSQAITRAAHEGNFSYETRTRLERIGGAVLYAAAA